MKRRDTTRLRKWVLSRPAWFYLWLPIGLISILHYSTGATHHWAHDIFRRLYYIPIVLGAFVFGRKGALAASITASAIYMPHAFTHLFHADPAYNVEKALEILLYNVVAFITGTLADRQYRTASRLEESLNEVRSMEQQLIRTGRLQALGELTAGLAHEIKNPLASIKGSVEIIADEIDPSSPRHRMVEILKKELDRVHSLLERFLNFARPGRLQAREITLCEVIDQTITLVGTRSIHDGIKIEWKRSGEEVKVHGDREMIVQVLFNLLLNAVEVSPDNGVVQVRCGNAVRSKRAYGYVEVEDQGPGIPEEQKEKIFNPFFTTKNGGTGLGLSIASRIVDEHGGFIEVEPAVGSGVLFRVWLPTPHLLHFRCF